MEAKQEVSILQQLMHLRAMTIRTGSIHEAQKIQLQNWGLLVPGTKKAKARLDMERKMVIYDLSPKAEDIMANEENNYWFKEINKWTKQILWPETTVIFECKKTVLYDSRSQK